MAKKQGNLPRCTHSSCSFNAEGLCTDFKHPTWDTCHEKDDIIKVTPVIQSVGPSMAQISDAVANYTRFTSGYDPSGEESTSH